MATRRGEGGAGLSLRKQWLMPAVVIGKVSLLSAVEFEKRIKAGVKWYVGSNVCV